MGAPRPKTKSADAATQAESAPEPTPVNGVLVARVDLDDGGFATEIHLIGDCRLSEVESLLKKGLAGFRERAGLAEG